MTTPTGDYSQLIIATMAPYQSEIEKIQREVTGDPAAVKHAEAAYHDGQVAAQRWSSSVSQSSTKLSSAWTGKAATRCGAAAKDLAAQLDRIDDTLSVQSEGMARAADALAKARAGIDDVARTFDYRRNVLVGAARTATAQQAQELKAAAAKNGTELATAARNIRTTLAKVLENIAASIRRAAATHAQARKAATAAAEARCPFTKRYQGSLFKSVVRHEANIPYLYDDGSGYATIGVGSNLDQKGGWKVFHDIVVAHPGGGYKAEEIDTAEKFKAVRDAELLLPKGKRRTLTDAQAEALFEHYLEEKRDFVRRKINNFESLDPPIRAALLNAAYNSGNGVLAAAPYINKGDMAGAADALEQWGLRKSQERDKNGKLTKRGLKDRYAELANMIRNGC